MATRIDANDPLTIAASAATLLPVAMAAVYLPARRAALLDPLAALRQEYPFLACNAAADS